MPHKLSRKLTKRFNIYRFSSKNITQDKTFVLKEEKYKVFINGEKLITLCLLPNEEIEFIYGFLFIYSIIDSPNDIVSCRICDNNNFHIYLRNFDINTLDKNFLRLNNLQFDNEILPVEEIGTVPITKLMHLYEKVETNLENNTLVKEFHKCLLYNNKDNYIVCYDIYSENALYKLIGYRIIQNLQKEEEILFTTDTITSNFVHKCIKAGFPVIATNKAVSSLALELAYKANIIIVEFINKENFIIYENNSNRVVNDI
jgi:FdhD protein